MQVSDGRPVLPDEVQLERARLERTKLRVYRLAGSFAALPVVLSWLTREPGDRFVGVGYPVLALALVAAVGLVGTRWLTVTRFETVTLVGLATVVVARIVYHVAAPGPIEERLLVLTGAHLWALPLLLVAAVLMWGRRRGLWFGGLLPVCSALVLGVGLVLDAGAGGDIDTAALYLVRVHAFTAVLLGLLAALSAAPEALQQAWQLAAEHRRNADTDQLTGLANRRAGERALDAAHATAERYGTPYALLALDLDGLKAINDTHGHAAGDRAIVEFARILDAAVRESDTAVRWGGDEFLIVAPQTDADEVAALASRCRELTWAARPAGLELSTSIGIAGWRPGDRASEVLERADAGLYDEKAVRRQADVAIARAERPDDDASAAVGAMLSAVAAAVSPGSGPQDRPDRGPSEDDDRVMQDPEEP